MKRRSHRSPTSFPGKTPEARELHMQVMPIVESLSRQILELLDNEQTETYQKGKYEGQRFNASKVAYGDLRNFDKKNPPHEQPSLAVAVRIDESGSMIRDDRIEAAKKQRLPLPNFLRKSISHC